METETLDKLYLEWSQFTEARTQRETTLNNGIINALKWLDFPDDEPTPGRVLHAKGLLARALREAENTNGR